MWTQFMDMYSGGGTKEPPYDYIYIEAPEEEARVIFYNRFGHSPERVSCTCCGNDYSVSSNADFGDLSGYERGCAFQQTLPDGTTVEDLPTSIWLKLTKAERIQVNKSGRYIEQPSKKSYARKYLTVDEYRKRADVLVIPASEIQPEERRGEIPTQGFVWVGD